MSEAHRPVGVGASAETSAVGPADAIARAPFRGVDHGARQPIPARERNESHAGARRASAFLPLLLLGLAVLGWAVFQTVELVGEHQSLTALRATQQRQVEESARLRTSLNTLASDTQRLADQGDAGAKAIVEQLKKRGITIHSGS